MYYKLIGCKLLEREIASVTYNCENVIDVTLIRQKLHGSAQKLNEALQEEITNVDNNTHRYSNDILEHDFSAILLGYGLCSNAISGLCSQKYPLVIPRAHDCVTFLLGNKDYYTDYYFKNPGTYYYSCGFAEVDTLNDEDVIERRFQMYLTRFKGNEKLAKKAIEIEKNFTATYNKITYISWEALAHPMYEQKAQAIAQEKSWAYERLYGKNTLLKQLVDGVWPEESFLIVPPGHRVEPSFDESILKCVAA